MTPQTAIRLSLDTGHMVFSAYLEGLSDADLMRRASPGINHINWQVGHLIVAEHQMVEKACPGSMPALPAGFAEKYAKETAVSDDASGFCSKAELLKVAAEQRAATVAALEKLTAAELDRETGIPYAPTVGAVMSLQGSHALMHAGQWAVVRRQLGHPPLF